MQYQKQQMREAILKAAEQEFTEMGYEKASMREICKRAGTSVGNLYRYFENREALFDALVGDLYRRIRFLIRDEIFVRQDTYDIPGIARHAAGVLFQNFGEDARRLRILLLHSKGSRYDDVMTEFSQLLHARILQEQFGNRYSDTADFLCSLLATGLMDAIRNLVRSDLSVEDTTALFEKVLFFYFQDIEKRLQV